MVKFIKFIFPVYAYKQYKELWGHIFNLEAAMDWEIKSPKYVVSEKVGLNGQQFR